MIRSGLDAGQQMMPSAVVANMKGNGISPFTTPPALAISLLFDPGRRPSLDHIALAAQHAAEHGHPFSISHQPPKSEGWVELLAYGLTFDLSGLAPMDAEPVPICSNRYGFKSDYFSDLSEAVMLVPGPHIEGGQRSMPVVRIMAGLALALAELPGISAVCWHPAQSMIEPKAYIRMIDTWLGGGAFPALGLTALNPEIDGGLRSQGLAFFIGQELRIEPDPGMQPAENAKLAVRLIHSLIETGRLSEVMETSDEQGRAFRLEPSANGQYIRVWRKG